MTIIIILRIFFIISIFLLIFLKLLEVKIWFLEKKIINTFKKRTNLIPSFYEISKKYIEKENEVFEEIIYLRKIEFYNVVNKINFKEFIENEKKIHYEIEFLFKVFDKKPKLQKEAKFLYLKDLLLDKTDEIWNFISLYKKIVYKYNKLLALKNLSIFWLLFIFDKKPQI